MGYDVFISFKRGALDGSGTTRDFELAADLHEALLANGVNAFFSERDLSTANFTREIYRALEEADILIVVGIKREHIESRWVSSEWETFLNAINADLKPDGQIYTYLEGITNWDLPYELFRYQFYTSAQKDDLVKRILQNLGKSASKPVSPSKEQPAPPPPPIPLRAKPCAWVISSRSGSTLRGLAARWHRWNGVCWTCMTARRC